LVAPFREVRHRLERQHASYSRAVQEYYDRRAAEYDDWYLGAGLFADRDRPGWENEVDRLVHALGGMPGRRTLDVACGTGFLTRHLRGDVVGIDQSEPMLAEARRQAPGSVYVQGDALSLPFPDQSFDRIFAAHFYGHLERSERDAFLAEARRVAQELVVVDSARAGAEQDEARQERTLNDGSRWEVYKRWFTAEGLASELGGGVTIFDGNWFVAVRST
jgi:ubiquinone/menaquinone biosynthesis C-methylase UbiE